MKSFLKVILSVLALGLVASVSSLHAQDGDAPKKGKGKGGPAMTAERVEQIVGTLTDDQKTKIADIIKKDTPEQGASREDRMAKMTAMNKDVRDVLTADQQKKWDDRPMPAGKKKKQQN